MSKVWLEVAEDKSRPEGGHAVIRLHGVSGLNQQPTFTIDPIDGDTGESIGRVNGAFAPLAMRHTPDGLELVVGPDVVENPQLLPGTPVAIEVAAAGVRAEVLWPSIMPLVRKRKPPVVSSTARRLTVVQAVRDQSRLAKASAAAALPAADDEPAPLREVATLATITRIEAGATVVPLPLAFVAPATRPEPAAPPGGAADAAALSLSQLAPALGARTAAEQATAVALARDEATVAVAPVGPLTQMPPRAPAPPASRVHTGRPSAPVPVSTALEPSQPRPAPVRRIGLGDADALGRRLSGIAMLMALLAIGSSLLVLQMVRSMRTPPAPVQEAAAGRASIAALALSPAIPAPPSAMYEIFKVGSVSPKGIDSGGVDISKALALADTYIHSTGSARDLREAEFWLKRALAMSLGDDRSRWALTQLGSLYAAPTEGDPNYEKARLAWEMAAGLGDPVAMCFLGNLFQFGLGVPASRGTALRWYELSKQSGGCRGVDDLIARAKR